MIETESIKAPQLPFLTLKQAVDETGIPESTFRRAIYARRLAILRTGSVKGRIRIARADLEAFVDRCRVPAVGERSFGGTSSIVK